MTSECGGTASTVTPEDSQNTGFSSRAAEAALYFQGSPRWTVPGVLASNRLTMKSNRTSPILVLIITLCFGLAPAYGANRDIVQLQTQVDQLQQQMTQMKQSFDERMGVMKNLVEQNTDVGNKVNATLKDLQTSINKQQQDRVGQVDQISGQIQALNDTMDELKVRLAKLSKQLEDMQSTQQSLAASQAQQQQQAQAIAQAPPPMCCITTHCATITAASPTSRRRSLTTTSSSIQIPI